MTLKGGYSAPPLGSGGPSASAMVIQTATPAAGQTVAMTADSNDRTLYLTPAGTLATLTVTMPADATSRLGQIARVASTQGVTLFTINGGTILNLVSSLNAGDCVTYQKVAANTWIRCI